MTEEPLETRLRQVLRLAVQPEDPPEGLGYVDMLECLQALGTIMAEILAHVPEAEAEAYMRIVLNCRRQWLAVPRVLDQLPAEGCA